MRIVICGSRDWTDAEAIKKEVDRLYARYGAALVVIHGAALGADSIAGACAQHRGIAVEPYPADWNKHGKKAGPSRNQQMLDTGVQGVVAFQRESSRGTQHMMDIARKANVPVIVYTM